MYKLRNLLIFTFLFNHSFVYGQNPSATLPPPINERFSFSQEQKNECVSQIKDIFTNLSDEKILNFVKVQTNLTLHRLAWTHLSHLKSQNKKTLSQNDTAEKSLLGLIGDTEAIISSEAARLRTDYFEEAKKQFDKKATAANASTYRQALATLAPNIRDAVKKKLKVQLKGAETVFALNSSDIMMMSLLSENVKNKKRVFDNLWKGYYDKDGKFQNGNNRSKAQFYSPQDNESVLKRITNDETGHSIYLHPDPTVDAVDRNKLKATQRINLLTMINSSYLNMDNSDKDIGNQIAKLNEVIPKLNKEMNTLFEEMVTPENAEKCFIQVKNGCQKTRSQNLMANFDEIANLLAQEVDKRAVSEDFQQQLIENLKLCYHHLRVAGECPDPDKQTVLCEGRGCKCVPKPTPPEPVRCDENHKDWNKVTKNCKDSPTPPPVPPVKPVNYDTTISLDVDINNQANTIVYQDNSIHYHGTQIIQNGQVVQLPAKLDYASLLQIIYQGQPQQLPAQQSTPIFVDPQGNIVWPQQSTGTVGNQQPGTAGNQQPGTNGTSGQPGKPESGTTNPISPLAEAWSIKANLHDYFGQPSGRMVDATVTRGKHPVVIDGETVDVFWEISKELADKLSAFKGSSSLRFLKDERSKTTFTQRHAIYIKGIKSYFVTAILKIKVAGSNEYKEVARDQVEIKKGQKYGEFNCNLPLNSALSVCRQEEGNFIDVGTGILGEFVW